MIEVKIVVATPSENPEDLIFDEENWEVNEQSMLVDTMEEVRNEKEKVLNPIIEKEKNSGFRYELKELDNEEVLFYGHETCVAVLVTPDYEEVLKHREETERQVEEFFA